MSPLFFSYKRYFTILMFLTEAMACLTFYMMIVYRDHLNALITCGFLTVIFSIITMSMHVLVRLEELLNKKTVI